MRAVLNILIGYMLAGCGSEKKQASIPEVKVACVNVQPTLDPANGYDGWQVVRFGVGQTVVKYTDECKVVPWLCDYDGSIVYGYPVRNVVSKQKIGKWGL